MHSHYLVTLVILTRVELSEAGVCTDDECAPATVQFLQSGLELSDALVDKADKAGDTFNVTATQGAAVAASSASVEKARMNEVVSLANDVETSMASAPGGNARAEWFAWDERIPMVSASDGSNAVNNSDFVYVWTYLGDKLWTEFIDGQFHKDGPHALDHTRLNMKKGMDGDYYGHSKDEYERFSSPVSWDTLWTADEFGHTNARYRGTECADPQCLDMYSHDVWTLSRRVKQGAGVQSQEEYAQSTHDQLDSLFAVYYNEVSPLQWEERHIRLQRGFMHLTNLFVDLARLHPFDDSNSRTRLLAFQTEVVRLGGHPVVLWDLRDDVYGICSPEASDTMNIAENWKAHSGLTGAYSDAPCGEAERTQLQELLLDGWCAWEVVATTGESPFLDGTHRRFYDASTASCVPSGVASG